ncbi:MAG: asparagine synthase (glutamine-hydrolyzing) [Phycisphaerae bacterium]
MCGIAGILLDEIDPAAADWLTAMTQRLYHRGPDDGGAVLFGMNGRPTVERRFGPPGEAVDWSFVPVKLGLGARRLAVVDRTEAGHQPLAGPDGRVWLVFNGEIYNHNALRSELSSRGMRFRGHGDTEVLHAAYRSWGCGCFERLDGMWAAAIVDWVAGRMVLTRDRLGIKPLYLARFEGGMAFASEIKSLLVLPGITRSANEARLGDFLCDGLVDHTNETLFENIWALPPGCWIELDLRGKGTMHAGGAVRRYWRPRFDWSNPPADAPREVARVLADSVAAQLRADVPIGSCLSGGVDSAAIVSLAHDLRGETVAAHGQWTQHTFTAALPGNELDETRHARAVVEACPGLVSHQVAPTAERFLDEIDALMWHQEQPFGSPSIYMQWEVMRLARASGVTVVLDGQGADELLCGYEGFIPSYLAHLLRHGRSLTFRREYSVAKRTHFKRGGLAGHVVAALLPEATRNRLRRSRSLAERPWLVRDLASVEPAPDFHQCLDLRPPDPDADLRHESALARRLRAVLSAESLPSLLRFEDRNSMAFSIEARVPFLSRSFVDLALRLPPETRIRTGRLKWVLREAMRGRVPDVILDRRDKIGFAAPTTAWMRGGLDDWWRERLTSKSFLDRGCFEPKGILGLIRRFDAGDGSMTGEVWRLAIVEQWARQFLDG